MFCYICENQTAIEMIRQQEHDFIGSELIAQNRIRLASSPFVCKGVTIGLPFNLEDLINCDLKRVIPEKVGIYHLFKDDILVYIGMSKNIRKRILGHYTQKEMDFDNVLWFCANTTDGLVNKTVAEIFKIERNMIKFHKPFYNEAYLSGY